jgi:hypothetical protein
MKQKSGPGKAPVERVLKDIRRQTRRQYSAEVKICIVLEGLRGEENARDLRPRSRHRPEATCQHSMLTESRVTGIDERKPLIITYSEDEHTKGLENPS